MDKRWRVLRNRKKETKPGPRDELVPVDEEVTVEFLWRQYFKFVKRKPFHPSGNIWKTSKYKCLILEKGWTLLLQKRRYILVWSNE